MKMKTLVIVMIVAMLLVVTFGTAFAYPPDPCRPPWSVEFRNIWEYHPGIESGRQWGEFVSDFQSNRR